MDVKDDMEGKGVGESDTSPYNCLNDGLGEPEAGDISSCQLTARIFFIFFLLAITSVLLTLVELYIGAVGVILLILLALGMCCGCLCRYIFILDYGYGSGEGDTDGVERGRRPTRRWTNGNVLNRHYSHTRHSATHCLYDNPSIISSRSGHSRGSRRFSPKVIAERRMTVRVERDLDSNGTEEDKLELIRQILTKELAGKAYPLDETTLPPAISLLAAAKKSDAAAYHYEVQMRGQDPDNSQKQVQTKDGNHVAIKIDQFPNGEYRTEILSRDRSLSL